MHPSRYSESYFLTSGDLDFLVQSHTVHSSDEPRRFINQNPCGGAPPHPLASHSFSTLPSRYSAAGYNPLSIFPVHPVQDDWYMLPVVGFREFNLLYTFKKTSQEHGLLTSGCPNPEEIFPGPLQVATSLSPYTSLQIADRTYSSTLIRLTQRKECRPFNWTLSVRE